MNLILFLHTSLYGAYTEEPHVRCTLYTHSFRSTPVFLALSSSDFSDISAGSKKNINTVEIWIQVLTNKIIHNCMCIFLLKIIFIINIIPVGVLDKSDKYLVSSAKDTWKRIVFNIECIHKNIFFILFKITHIGRLVLWFHFLLLFWLKLRIRKV